MTDPQDETDERRAPATLGAGAAHRRSDPAGTTTASTPELRACDAVRPLITWDRVAVVAASDLDLRLPLPGSDAALRWFGDLQQSLTQGPGVDVLATGLPLLVDDLHVPVARWTLLQASLPADFAPRTLAILPLTEVRGGRRSGDLHRGHPPTDAPLAAGPHGTITGTPPGAGILVVARDTVRPFTADQVHLLEALAALVGGIVLHRSATGELFDAADAPGAGAAGTGTGDYAGDAVSVVVGMLSAHLGADTQQATAWLRAHSFSAGATIHEVARAVLAGRTGLDELTRPS